MSRTKEEWDKKVPVAFDTFEDAFKRAMFYEDRVDAVKDYEDLMKSLTKTSKE